MQKSLFQTASEGVLPSDIRFRRQSIRQRMQKSLYNTADAEVSIRQRMQETFYQTADAGYTFIRQWMQETLYQTADAEVSLSHSGCRGLSIRHQMQETLYQMQPLSDRLSLCIRCLIERLLQPLFDRKLLHPLSDRVSPASTLSHTQSDSGCRSLSISQWMQESLNQTADEGDTLSDSGCRRHPIRQRMQKSLY